MAAASAGTVLQILNLFSGAEVSLPAKQRRVDPGDHEADPSRISKIVFSQEPDSTGCILAAITLCTIALCRLANGCAADKAGGAGAGWTWTTAGMQLADIAFCNGELYGVKLSHNLDMVTLLKFDIGVNEDGGVAVTGIDTVAVLSLQAGHGGGHREIPLQGI